MIGDLTHTLTCDVASFEARGPVRLRGKTELTSTWLVSGLVASPGVELERSFSTPYVGREVESGILQGLFRKVVASAAPQFALVVAEAGLGKSRLLYELAGWLDQQSEVLAWWRQAECPAFGDGLSVWPVSQIVRQHTGIADEDDPETVEGKLRPPSTTCPIESGLPSGCARFSASHPPLRRRTRTSRRGSVSSRSSRTRNPPSS